MKKIIFITIFIFILSILCAQSIDDLVPFTEEYPPYNYTSKGVLEGISIDLIERMFEISLSKLRRKDIIVASWARGYYSIQNKKNAVLFATTRSKSREKLFKWVGPITPTSISLHVKNNSNIKISNYEDIKAYTVCVIRDDIAQQLLLENGIETDKLIITTTTEQNIQLLNMNRADIWAYECNAAFWALQANGYNLENYKTIFTLEESELWFAFNNQTPDSVIKQLQKALNSLVETGEYQDILDKYIH